MPHSDDPPHFDIRKVREASLLKAVIEVSDSAKFRPSNRLRSQRPPIRWRIALTGAGVIDDRDDETL
jgi:hypothetical protein